MTRAASGESTRGKKQGIEESVNSVRLGVIHMCRGQYQEAFEIFIRTPLEQNPALLGFCKPNALFRLGRTEEASALVEQVLKTYPKDQGGAVTSVKG